MIVSPFALWFRGLMALTILGAGVYFLARWRDELPTEVFVQNPQSPDGPAERRPLTGFAERVTVWRPDWDGPTAFLAGGLGAVVLSLGGRLVSPRLWLRRGGDDPRAEREGQAHQLRRPDGTVLHVEVSGPADGPPVVLTHGWGADATAWYYLRRDLATRHRVIAWDLPGLGLSTQPDSRDFSLDKMARDLEAVLGLAGGRPAVLVGHSIGGMATLTLARLFPEALGTRVAGLVLVHTTYTNPLHTKVPTWLLPTIQKPILEPLCWLTVALAPLVRLMAWLGYLNGSAHWSVHRKLFAGTETRGQLDFVARYTVKASPAVVARGTLAMFSYDATAVLPAVPIPVLVVAAAGDETTIPEASRRIADAVPGAELVTLTPAKHMGLVERHAEFSELVGRFCAARAVSPELR